MTIAREVALGLGALGIATAASAAVPPQVESPHQTITITDQATGSKVDYRVSPEFAQALDKALNDAASKGIKVAWDSGCRLGNIVEEGG